MPTVVEQGRTRLSEESAKDLNEIQQRTNQNHESLRNIETEMPNELTGIREFIRSPLSGKISNCDLELDRGVRISSCCYTGESTVPNVRGGCLIRL
jgi:hypothetical protein